VTYEELFALADEAGLSPEKLGELLGVSGMTLRRWRKEPAGRPLPKVYDRAFSAGVQELVADGRIAPDSPRVQAVMAETTSLSFTATLKALGFTEDTFQGKDAEAKVVDGLSRVGAAPGRIESVDRSEKKLFSFGKRGEDWSGRMATLLSVIRSGEVLAHKFVAYGALFYLLMPFDFVPDAIPVFGLLDDFTLIGFAAAHYRKKSPALFRRPGTSRR
jgi:uncharacterized membrane protein YkvA (DUF1232 family)